MVVLFLPFQFKFLLLNCLVSLLCLELSILCCYVPRLKENIPAFSKFDVNSRQTESRNCVPDSYLRNQ